MRECKSCHQVHPVSGEYFYAIKGYFSWTCKVCTLYNAKKLDRYPKGKYCYLCAKTIDRYQKYCRDCRVKWKNKHVYNITEVYIEDRRNELKKAFFNNVSERFIHRNLAFYNRTFYRK